MGFMKEIPSSLTVQDIMTRDPIRVHEDTRLDEVFRLFTEHQLNCLPVVDDADHIQGCIMLRDMERSRQLFDLKEYLGILMSSLPEKTRQEVETSFSMDEPINLTAREVMTVRVLEVSPSDPLDETCTRMAAGKNHYAIVINADRQILGIVSSFDFVKLFQKVSC